MSPTEQKQLGAFLESRGKKDVREYLKIVRSASPEEQTAAGEKRRIWAQAQQTNPKFQEEALWVLAHTHLLQEALERPEEELLWLKPSIDGSKASEPQRDHYALLGVASDATFQQIQDAHRLRYRDARQLRSRHEAHQVYAELDEAWRILSDSNLRAQYDAENTAMLNPQSPPTEHVSDHDALTHSPDLAFTGPSQIQFTLSGKPVQHTLRVERIGTGLVDATIRSDQPWLTVSPERLDPHAASQALTLTMLPSEVPGKGALGQLVLKNFNGQRLALHVRVEIAPETPVRRSFWMAVACGGLLLAAGWAFGGSFLPSQTNTPVIHLTVSPSTAEAWINNTKQPSNWPVQIDELPADSPVRLRVVAEGHEDHEETLVLSAGQELTKTIRLNPLPETFNPSSVE